jgi:rhodanese-related sulfurtransferase
MHDNTLWIASSLLGSFILLLTACAAQQPTEADFREMLDGLYRGTVPLLKQEEVDESYILLDTREREEYDISHLPGALWVGYDKLQQEVIDSLPKDRPILLYCSVGYRSERTGEKLQKQGFQEVYNLYGGIFDWVNKGQGIQDSSGKSTLQVHTYNKKWSKWLFKGEKVW